MTAFCFEICCIGYGFDASNIKKKEWINLIKKYNPAQYEQIKKEVAITNKTVYERVSDEMISADIFEYLNELKRFVPSKLSCFLDK